MIEVQSGMENLSEKTETEKEMGLDDNQRLACQFKIKDGDINIKY